MILVGIAMTDITVIIIVEAIATIDHRAVQIINILAQITVQTPGPITARQIRREFAQTAARIDRRLFVRPIIVEAPSLLSLMTSHLSSEALGNKIARFKMSEPVAS